MKSQKIPRKRRAVSPVIATVILVAVAITIAVAVSYWMSGISSQYTAFEKVEIQTGYATIEYNAALLLGWNVSITMKNTGSAASTLTHVFVNEIPVDIYLTTTGKLEFTAGGVGGTQVAAAEIGASFLATGLTLESGESEEFYVLIGKDSLGGYLSSGTTVNIKIHSAGGMDYIKLIKLV